MRKKPKNVKQPLTIDDIAQELGLSKTTISRVISGKGRIGADTRERVLSHIKELGYRPNLIAKSLAVSKTFNIAVALPSDAEVNEIPFFQNCLHSITETANARDYDVVLSVTTGQNIMGLKRLIRNRKVDGVILTRPLIDDKAVVFLREFGIPFVLIGSSDDPSIVQVDSDHFAGCREVTAHLIGNGFRRVALMAGNPAHQVNKDRYAGFLAALSAAGIDSAEAPVYWNAAGETHIDRAMSAAIKLKPECILCSDDVICGKALSWLRMRGLEVPADVRIASFHDSVFMERHDPPVTSLRIDVPELGATAGNILLDMIDGKKVPERSRLGYEIAIRESSRPR